MKKQLIIVLMLGIFLATFVAAQSIGNVTDNDGGYYMGPGMMGGYYGYGMMQGYYPNMMYSYPVYQNQNPFNTTNILLGVLIALVIVLIIVMLVKGKK